MTRWINPSAFLLVLLLFGFLPVAAASCDVPRPPSGPGSVELSYSGAQLVRGRGTLTATGTMAVSEPQSASAEQRFEMSTADTVLAVVTMVALAAGVGVTVRWRRVWPAVVVAAVAAALLAVTELFAATRLEDHVHEVVALGTYLPEMRDLNAQSRVGEVVHAGLGFWLPLAGLGLVLAGNVVRLVRQQRG